MMNIEYISAKSLEAYINKEKVIIIDLRDKKDYKRGHVPSAINIEYENLELYKQKLSRYRQIVLYCDRGSISLLAARDLSRMGYNIVNVIGGYQYYRGKISTIDNIFVD
jgi:rhodanese-related sulfurtransferase